MTARAYETTQVPVARSQGELRDLLRKFGAQQFSFGEGADWAGVEFIHADQLVRVRCPLKPPDANAVSDHYSKNRKSPDASRQTLLNREAMRVWRVLVWTIKARLVAVEEGLETFEQAFLAAIVDPATNRTIWEQAREAVEGGAFKLGGAGLRAIGTGTR
jgi:hypothetical protein